MAEARRPFVGRHRTRLVLEEPVESPDTIGGVTRGFAIRATLWAAVEPVSGLERAEADRAEGAVSQRVTIRWRGDVTTAMRFSLGARRLAIRAQYDPDGRRRTLVCLCEEVQA